MPTIEITYTPHGAARSLFQRRDDELVISGPAGSGKTLAALHKVHLAASRHAGMRALLLRKTHTSLAATALVTYREHVLSPWDAVEYYGGSAVEPPQYRYPNGSRLLLGGLDNPTRIMSADYDMIYICESTELTEAEWEMVTSRARFGVMPYTQVLADCNPGPPSHWLRQRAHRGDLTMLESRHEDNPRLWDAVAGAWTAEGAAYIARLDRLTGVRKARLRHGLWAAAEGMVYEGWDAAVHVVGRDQLRAWGVLCDDDDDDGWPRLNREQARHVYGGADWGYTHPGSLLVVAVDGDGRLAVLHEVYQTRRTIDWWIAMARSLQAHYGVERWVADPSEPAYIAQFNDAGLPTLAGNNRIGPGIQAVQQRLVVQPDGRPRLVVLRGALADPDPELVEARKPLGLLDEVEGYVWDTTGGRRRGELPVDLDNHSLDGIRYLCALDLRRPRGAV